MGCQAIDAKRHEAGISTIDVSEISTRNYFYHVTQPLFYLGKLMKEWETADE